MVDELKGLIRNLTTEVGTLADDVEAFRTQQAKLKGMVQRWTAALMIVGLVLAVVVWRVWAYSDCNTSRSRALTGPGNDRVSELESAFQAAVKPQKLTPKQRASDLQMLAAARRRYGLIPAAAKLVTVTDSQLVIYVHVVRSLDAQAAYDKQLRAHHVCSIWGVK